MRLPSWLLLVLVGVPGVVAQQPPGIPVEASVLRAAGGTYVFSLFEPLGTAVMYAWRATRTEPQEFQFVVQGPPGWNGDKPHNWRLTRSKPGLYVWKEELRVPAVPGVYTLTAEIDGYLERAQFSVAAGPEMAVPELEVTVDQERVIRVLWEPVPDARSYEVGFTDLAGQHLIRAFSRGKNHAFYVHLTPGQYRARVAAYTFDFGQRITDNLVIPQQFHGIENTVEFMMP